jgi:hypothetical protein
LTDCAGGFDVKNDSILGVDQIVGGIGKEGWSLERAGPLSSRIGRRDEFGRYLRRCTESGIIEPSQILLHGSHRFGFCRKRIVMIAWDRTLPVGIRGNQAGIRRKALAADQPLGEAAGDNALKKTPKNVAVPEAPVPVARERRVIRHFAIQAQAAKPAIGKVQVHLLTQPPLRPDPHAIANDQHPDHQVRVNRRSTNGAVKWRKRAAQRRQIKKPVDTA